MYANLHTFISLLPSFFYFRCKQTANKLQTNCKQTAKKGKTKNSLSLPLSNFKNKDFSPT